MLKASNATRTIGFNLLDDGIKDEFIFDKSRSKCVTRLLKLVPYYLTGESEELDEVRAEIFAVAIRTIYES